MTPSPDEGDKESIHADEDTWSNPQVQNLDKESANFDEPADDTAAPALNVSALLIFITVLMMVQATIRPIVTISRSKKKLTQRPSTLKNVRGTRVSCIYLSSDRGN
jgi:hypothetical protein